MDANKHSKTAALEVAKSMRTLAKPAEYFLEAYQIKVRLVPVPPQMIDEVSNRIKDPDVPLVPNPDRPTDKYPDGKPEPNPFDPAYTKAMEEAVRQRGLAAIDTMCLLGIELVDGMPEDERWLSKLRYMEKRGLLSLSAYDLNDPLDKEFLFKRFMVASNEIIQALTRVSGITSEEVAKAEQSFPS